MLQVSPAPAGLGGSTENPYEIFMLFGSNSCLFVACQDASLCVHLR